MALAERIYAPMDDETVLAGILYNAKLRLMQPNGAFQLAGPMGPRLGEPETDAIPFTGRSCETVYRYLSEHGVRCVRVRTHSPRQEMHSIVLGSDTASLLRLLEIARRTVRRTAITHPGLKMDVLDSPDGTATA